MRMKNNTGKKGKMEEDQMCFLLFVKFIMNNNGSIVHFCEEEIIYQQRKKLKQE